MTTIIVTHEDNRVDEFEFKPEQTTITLGRRSTNDVCIPDLSVSGTHATLTLANGETVLEDRGSTNGSYVNGQVINRTTVSSSDEIILGKIQISFRVSSDASGAPLEAHTDNSTLQAAESVMEAAGPAAANSSDNDDVKTVAALKPENTGHSVSVKEKSAQRHPLEGLEHKVVPTASEAAPNHDLDSPSNASNGAVIEIKNGAKSGQILPIDKPVTTLGRPGIQIAAIMRKPDGYFLMHIESDENVERPTLNRDTIGDEPVMLHSGDALTVAGIDVEFMLS